MQSKSQMSTYEVNEWEKLASEARQPNEQRLVIKQQYFKTSVCVSSKEGT